MKQVLTILPFEDPWHVAFWIDSCNSWFDGRQPFKLIDSEPKNIIAVAQQQADRAVIG